MINDRARIRVRKAALEDASRSGDLAFAARAGARLRVRGAHLDDKQVATARRARHALGRALYAARMRQAGELPRVIREPLPKRKPRPWRRIAAAVTGLALGVVAVVVVLTSGLELGGFSGDNAPQPVPTAVTQVTDPSRGRSSGEIPVVAVESPQPTAVPTASAVPVSTERPRAPGPPGPIVAKGGKVPLDLPGVLPGYVRMTILVQDSAGNRPLEDVCVVYGTFACGPEEPKTNSAGIWALDVPVTNNPIPWDFRFQFPGYQTTSQRITTRSQDVFVVVNLERN